MFRTVHLVRDEGGLAPDEGADALGPEYAVVDLETTGLDPRHGHRVCEIAVVRVRGDGEVVEEFSSLVDPGRSIPKETADHHGIGDGDVAGAPAFGQLADTLLRLLHGAVTVAHNLPFEERFLAAEFGRLGWTPPEPGLPGLCTVSAFRAQLDWPAYRLPGAVRSLSGRWPRTEHVALADARNTAAALTTLLAAAPSRLVLRPVPVWPSPLVPPGGDGGGGDGGGDGDVRAVPRAYPATGRRGDLAGLCRSLPVGARTVPDAAGAAAYRTALEARLARSGRVTWDGAAELGALMGRAGFGRESLRALHREVWHAALRRAGSPVPEDAARRLHGLARLLDVPELARELPAVHEELSGVRLVPRGEDAEVRAVTAWAGRHGATLGTAVSKNTDLVVAADVGRAARLKAVRDHGIPVLTPRQAEDELRRRIARAEEEREREREKGGTEAAGGDGGGQAGRAGTRLVFPVSGPPVGWRRHELPAELCDSGNGGGYARAVRRLVEDAADPAVPYVRFTRDPRPTLTVHRDGVPGELREQVDEALDRLRRHRGGPAVEVR
ncbi:exonuclease domain-containing protein [Streptomyces sp. TRM 70361]|uniref:exonuclease domain-containing protein n=1 Tax=Streptomyces sp. TRM 70361 TaxID=3116553 RepID=UPI002E7B5B89|nr:exonuclease domain-containing protein [Streptomyces sp. TRM 70361]MEE1941480.1 exonuclease domain-containing protein [Streptomyces sp. TRM 70361]